MYKFILKESYRELVFVFDDFNEGCLFMIQALNHCSDEVKFIVCPKEEVEDEE